MSTVFSCLTRNRLQTGFLFFLIIISCFFAWQHYFIQDDAFISFRYARHFAEGHGLVWEPGSNEFGYTSFLFTFLVGCLMALGLGPELAAMLLSIPAYALGMVLVFMIARHLSPRGFAPHAAALATAAHYTVASYASGGLETSLHMCLVLLVYTLVFYQARPWPIAVATSVALLCRLDSALLLLPAYGYLTWNAWKKFQPADTGTRRALIIQCLPLALLPLATVAMLLAGCYFYYGYALPTTFYSKLFFHRTFYREGLNYLFAFAKADSYFPLVLAYLALVLPLIMGKWHALTARRHEIATLIAGILIWLGYLIYIGGDFMEFRLLVPILPLFYITCFHAIGTAVGETIRWPWIGLLAAVLGISAYHGKTFSGVIPIASVNVLHEQCRRWEDTGKALGALFYTGSPNDVRLAVHPAGAIPYHSGLPTVDIYGLNDRWVTFNGRPGIIAGHRRIAPFEYLEKRKVNIIFPSLPRYVCKGDKPRPMPAYNKLPALLIPLENDCSVVGYYLAPHPRIETLLRSEKIKVEHE